MFGTSGKVTSVDTESREMTCGSCEGGNFQRPIVELCKKLDRQKCAFPIFVPYIYRCDNQLDVLCLEAQFLFNLDKLWIYLQEVVSM